MSWLSLNVLANDCDMFTKEDILAPATFTKPSASLTWKIHNIYYNLEFSLWIYLIITYYMKGLS